MIPFQEGSKSQPRQNGSNAVIATHSSTSRRQKEELRKAPTVLRYMTNMEQGVGFKKWPVSRHLDMELRP